MADPNLLSKLQKIDLLYKKKVENNSLKEEAKGPNNSNLQSNQQQQQIIQTQQQKVTSLKLTSDAQSNLIGPNGMLLTGGNALNISHMKIPPPGGQQLDNQFIYLTQQQVIGDITDIPDQTKLYDQQQKIANKQNLGKQPNSMQNGQPKHLKKHEKDEKEQRKKIVTMRKVADMMWEDQTLLDWPDNDYRIFCGNLGNEVTDEVLANAFRKYGSFQRARVVRDKRTSKTKGFGFVSFMDPGDYLKAFKEMNGKYVGNRPVKIQKSNWRERSLANHEDDEITAIYKKPNKKKPPKIKPKFPSFA